jgi:hypothetical protein
VVQRILQGQQQQQQHKMERQGRKCELQE